MSTALGSIVVLPGDVAALQRSIHAQAEPVRDALQRCADAGTFTPTKTPVEWKSWESLMARVRAFVAESPSLLSSGSQYDRGEAIQKELAEWYEKAKALGCDAGSAPVAPAGGLAELSLSSMFSGVSTMALLVLAVLFMMRHK